MSGPIAARARSRSSRAGGRVDQHRPVAELLARARSRRPPRELVRVGGRGRVQPVGREPAAAAADLSQGGGGAAAGEDQAGPGRQRRAARRSCRLAPASDGTECAGEPRAAGEHGQQAGGRSATTSRSTSFDRVDHDVPNAGGERPSSPHAQHPGPAGRVRSPAARPGAGVCRCQHPDEVRVGHRGERVVAHRRLASSRRRRRRGGRGRWCGRARARPGRSAVVVSPIASSRASATGPMLPSSVESNVEQYLK